jgi:hypothetical protein
MQNIFVFILFAFSETFLKHIINCERCGVSVDGFYNFYVMLSSWNLDFDH